MENSVKGEAGRENEEKTVKRMKPKVIGEEIGAVERKKREKGDKLSKYTRSLRRPGAGGKERGGKAKQEGIGGKETKLMTIFVSLRQTA